LIDRPKDLTVLIAAYNESAVIGANVRRILDALAARPEVDWELVLVNDGSRDDTGQILETATAGLGNVVVLHHRRNFGQGRALRTGLDVARGRITVTLDADLTYGPEYIWLLYDNLLAKDVDVVLASAYAKGGGVSNVPFHRYVLSRWGNRYLAMMSSYKISTLTCVVRAYHTKIFDTLPLTSNGMELQIEILMKAAMLGLRVAEIPANLAWAPGKRKGAGLRRASKMRILRSIRVYFMLGWLSRPSHFIFFLSLVLLLPALYIGVWLSWHTLTRIRDFLGAGESLNWALSLALRSVFEEYTYSFALGGGLTLMSLLILLFSLIFLQNQFYFQEMFLANHTILSQLKLVRGGYRADAPEVAAEELEP